MQIPTSITYVLFAFVSLTMASDPSRSALTLTPQLPSFAFDLTPNLPVSSVSSQQTLTSLPESCSSTPESECPQAVGMVATNVTLEDCSDPWTICRCNNANMTLDTVVDRFSRVPVGLRRFVRSVVVLGDNSTHAYTLTTGDIHFFGDCQMDTWVHESSHAYDFSNSSDPISGSPEWSAAVGNDSCVPDEYSATNIVEDFAQMSVLKVYAVAHNGALPPGFAKDCMSKQLAFMENLAAYNGSALFGPTCAIDDGVISNGHNSPPPTLDASKTYPLPDDMRSTVMLNGASGFVMLPSATSTSIKGANGHGNDNAAVGVRVRWSWEIAIMAAAGTVLL